MSYPYYYPCYSARSFQPTRHAQDTLHALHRSYLHEERIRIEEAVRQEADVISRQRVINYEQDLKDKQQMYQLMERSRIQADIQQSKMRLIEEERMHDDYLRRIGSSQKQYRGAMGINNKILTDRKRGYDWQNEKLIQTYQQELLGKIRDNNNKKMEEEGNNTHLEKTSNIEGTHPIINRKNNQQSSNKQACSFSNSAINATLQHRTPRDTNHNKYATLEIDNSKSNQPSSDDTPFKDKYMTHRYASIANDKERQRPNKSLTTYRQNKRNQSYFNSVLKDHQAQKGNIDKNVSENCLKRIQNRLKVSAIIYKDSSLRNKKHQMQHLRNTYQTQLRLRNQIKDRINSNPQILKKHHMVISAR